MIRNAASLALVAALGVGRYIGMPPAPYVPVPLERPQGPIPALTEAAQKHNVPLDLMLSVALTESGPHLRCDRVSKAGAIGLMQIMPRTARGLGVARDQLKDCHTSADTGARLLALLIAQCDGDRACTTSRYNSGRAVNLPPETLAYNAVIGGLMR